MTTYWWYKIDTTRQQLSIFFFFNDTATTEIYTLSLHDALPICIVGVAKSTNNGATFSTPFDASTTSSNTTEDRKSTRLNSSHSQISYAVFCLKKKKNLYTILSTLTPPYM